MADGALSRTRPLSAHGSKCRVAFVEDRSDVGRRVASRIVRIFPLAWEAWLEAIRVPPKVVPSARLETVRSVVHEVYTTLRSIAGP